MLRFLLIIICLWFCGEVFAQGVTVNRSDEIVVIRGKSYYLHTVEQKQTIFSISRAYGVTPEEIKKENNKNDDALSLYEVLKIPFVDPAKQQAGEKPRVKQDGKYYYYEVGPRETIYSISRRFDIKAKRLLRHNDEFAQGKVLPLGAIIRLPLNEIDRSVLNKYIAQLEGSEKPAGHQTIIDKKDIGAIDTLISRPQQIVVGDNGRDTMPSYLSEVVMPDDPFVKIALLLPFYAKNYPHIDDSLAMVQYALPVNDSLQFLYFYEGMLLAVDSLKNKGYNIDLRVFDTERNIHKTYDIAAHLNHDRPDLIIGPVYASTFATLADKLENKNIPLIYPLSSRRLNLGMYPNFVQVNASSDVLENYMADWLMTQSTNANIVQIHLSKPTAISDTTKIQKTTWLNRVEGLKVFDWYSSVSPVGSFKELLLPDRENIIVFPTTDRGDVDKILPYLTLYADKYKITVLGMPEWQLFTNIEHENYFKLNTKIFTNSYVDRSTDAAKKFEEKFRNYFNTEPNALAYKAYDIGFYFIELAAKYRDRTLEAINFYPKTGDFSQFEFGPIKNAAGKENHGFFIVTYGSDYQLKVEPLKLSSPIISE